MQLRRSVATPGSQLEVAAATHGKPVGRDRLEPQGEGSLERLRAACVTGADQHRRRLAEVALEELEAAGDRIRAGGLRLRVPATSGPSSRYQPSFWWRVGARAQRSSSGWTCV